MELLLLAVGRLRPVWREAADEYLKRLLRYGRVTETEVREAGRSPTAATARREEAKRLRERLPRGARRVALERTGQGWTSEQIAARLDTWRHASVPVVLLLGGSHGLDPSLVAECEECWSLGPLTFPHELARVIVLEQLYRGATILRGEPYHK